MRTREFLETHRGQAYRRRHRQLRTVHAHIVGEPRSKGGISEAEQRSFQVALVQSLGARHDFRGKVALELDFTVTEPNPPAVHTLAKNYLDLLMRPVANSPMTHQKRLYIDDRQVKFLVVNYHLHTIGGPGIFLRARPMRDLLEDLRLLSKILRGGLQTDDKWSDQKFEGLKGWKDDEQHFDDDDLYDELREHHTHREEYSRQSGAATWHAYNHHLRYRIQQKYLANSDRWLKTALLGYPDIAHEDNADGLEPALKRLLATASRTLLLTGSISLAGLPQRQGEGNVFKAAVRTQLKSMVQRIPIMSKMEAPLSVTIFCIPPENGGIDLDNLARSYIVPAVHEVLKPPSSHARSLAFMTGLDPTNYGWLKTELERIKRMPPCSITRYTVIEVDRLSGDPREGEVRISLGDGTNPTGVLVELDHALNDWEDQVW